MSTLGDVLAALRKVILLEDNVTQLQRQVEALTEDGRRTRGYIDGIDRRLVRIETMVEMTTGRAPAPPAIEE